MAILKHGRLEPDRWTLLEADAPLTQGSAVVLPLERFLSQAEALRGRNAEIGVHIAAGEDVVRLQSHLAQIALICVEFPKFRDGRGFSTARILRERFAFAGEIRAVGHVIPDQYPFLLRAGFDTVALRDDAPLQSWLAARDAIPVAYQASVRDEKPLAGLKRRIALSPQGMIGPQSARARELNARFGMQSGIALLRPILETELKGEIALVSSFGTESAVLLDMVAQVDPSTPILFLETGKLFEETLRYRDELVAHLGLRDVRAIRPDPIDLLTKDPNGILNMSDTEGCCNIRKVLPLAKALAPFNAWVTGRKRYQGGERGALTAIELFDGKIKVNPLWNWTSRQIAEYRDARTLPRHPLEAQGYLSVGCWPCTTPVAEGEDARAGRWRGSQKTECGIHNSPVFQSGAGI